MVSWVPAFHAQLPIGWTCWFDVCCDTIVGGTGLRMFTYTALGHLIREHGLVWWRAVLFYGARMHGIVSPFVTLAFK